MTIARRSRPSPGSAIQERIFDEVGLLRGVRFSPASNRRPSVIEISIARGTPNPLATGMSVDGKDFRSVYKNIVLLVAAYYEVLEDRDLVDAMHATCGAFLKKFGLTLEPVVIKYEQVCLANATQDGN